jgi:FecR protein
VNAFRAFLVQVLCLLLIATPVSAAPQGGAQQAGQISALIPAATRNTQTAKVNEEVDWNDLLKTEHSGRMRATLTDGSILSVGTNSELRVVQHDANTQQTSLELNFGKVRSQVVKITKADGKFQVKTPNAVIGVIGTDLYVAFAGNKTTVICYQGVVSVNPVGKVQVAGNGQAAGANSTITVNAGQMVVITSVVPPGGFQTSDTPPALAQSTQLSTDIPSGGVKGYRPGQSGNGPTWVFIGSAVAAGVAAGVLGTHNWNNNCRPGPNGGCAK